MTLVLLTPYTQNLIVENQKLIAEKKKRRLEEAKRLMVLAKNLAENAGYPFQELIELAKKEEH